MNSCFFFALALRGSIQPTTSLHLQRQTWSCTQTRKWTHLCQVRLGQFCSSHNSTSLAFVRWNLGSSVLPTTLPPSHLSGETRAVLFFPQLYLPLICQVKLEQFCSSHNSTSLAFVRWNLGSSVLPTTLPPSHLSGEIGAVLFFPQLYLPLIWQVRFGQFCSSHNSTSLSFDRFIV